MHAPQQKPRGRQSRQKEGEAERSRPPPPGREPPAPEAPKGASRGDPATGGLPKPAPRDDARATAQGAHSTVRGKGGQRLAESGRQSPQHSEGDEPRTKKPGGWRSGAVRAKPELRRAGSLPTGRANRGKAEGGRQDRSGRKRGGGRKAQTGQTAPATPPKARTTAGVWAEPNSLQQGGVPRRGGQLHAESNPGAGESPL